MSAGTDDHGAHELLENATWIRALARTLTRDPSAADDLVQETWTAALHHRPETDRPLRPWLGTVLRNFARRSQVRADKRSNVERLSRGPADECDPAETCEGLEASRVLTEELGRLEEPYRSVLFLRYYRDLEPTAIARRQGIPPATVRSHLKRGVERLRARLDQRFEGNHGAWCALFLPLTRSSGVGVAAATVPSIALTGLLVMNASLKIAAGLAAVVVAYVGLSVTDVLPERVSLFSESEVVAEAPAPVVETVAPALVAVDTTATPRRALDVAAPAAAEDVAVAAIPVPSPTVIDAEIVDGAGVAVRGVELRVLSGQEVLATTPSNSRGHTSLELELDREERTVVVEASARGYASIVQRAAVRRGETTSLGVIMLLQGGSISGVVVDENGLGVSGARVSLGESTIARMDIESLSYARAERALHTEPTAPSVLTDAVGMFTLTGVDSGNAYLWADAADAISCYSKSIMVRAGENTPDIELVVVSVGPTNSIEGIVLDPHGEPVPFAELFYHRRSLVLHYGMSTTKEARGDGTFRFVLSPDSVLSITARDPQDRYGLVAVEELRPGEFNLELRLHEGRDVELVALDDDGQPLESFHYSVLDEAEEVFLQRGEGHAGAAHFRLPQQTFVVHVTAPLHDLGVLGPLDPGLSGTDLSVQLEGLPGVVGQVLASGQPVSGAKVSLHRLIDDTTRFENRSLRCWLSPFPLDEVTTDGDGRFRLTARTARDYVVQVEHEGYALAEHDPFPVEPAQRGDSLVIELGAGGVIEGRVTRDDDEDPAGQIVALHRGDGLGQFQRVNESGEYRFEHLTPGSWFVEVREEELEMYINRDSRAVVSFEDEVVWNCEVFEGRTTFHDLTVADPWSLVFQGRVRVEGVDSSSFNVFICGLKDNFYNGSGTSTSVAPTKDGYFELGVAEPGEYRLVLRRSHNGEEWMILDEITVAAGIKPWNLSVDTGSLEITGIDAAAFAQDIPPFVYVWRGQNDLVLMQMPTPTTSSFTLSVVPVGQGQLVIPSMQAALDPGSWEPASEFEVTRGETTRTQAP